MKWLFCLSALGLGLLAGRLTNQWLRSEWGISDASSPLPSTESIPAVPASSSEQAAWSQLMERARTEALQDLDTVIRRGKAGPLDYLGCIERDLSLWREIELGADAGKVSGILLGPKGPTPKIRKVRDWAPSGVDMSKFLYWHLGRRDPEGALKAIDRSELGAQGPIFAAWAEMDFQAALKALEENCTGLDHAYHTVTVLSVLARRDPAAAIRLADSVRRVGEAPVPGILEALAVNHPHQALEFLLNSENALTPDQAWRLVTETVSAFANGPDGSPWESLSRLADRPELAFATGESLGEQTAVGSALPSEALSIFEKLPPEGRERALLSGMAVALYRADPALADQTLAGLPEEAAGRSVEAAAAAAMQGDSIHHPPDVEQGLGIASRLPYERQWELVDTWVGYGHSTAPVWEEWVSKVDDPQWRDQLAGKLAAQFEKSDPAGAVRLAASIQDEARREAALTASLTAWRARDSAAATAWEAGLKGGDPP